MVKLIMKIDAAIVTTVVITYAIAINCVYDSSIALEAKETSVFTKVAPKSMPSVSSASVAVNDSNWAGYIIASNLQNPQPTVTNISASWIVPSVNPSSLTDSYSAVWIGIGGFFDNTLIQTGTEQDSIGGQSVYLARYELLPQISITIGTISPGDQMNASIQLVNAFTDTWQIYIQDLTLNLTFQSNFTYAASKLSAEWIVERPAIGQRGATLAALADIGSVAINNCLATVGTQNGTINTFPVVQSIMYDIVQNTAGITQLTAVSSLSADGSSFTVETSRTVVPELLGLEVLPLTMGISLLAMASKKWYSKKKDWQSI